MDPLHAGKYAAFVYSAYGISAVTLLVLVAQTLLAARKARRDAQGEADRDDAR